MKKFTRVLILCFVCFLGLMRGYSQSRWTVGALFGTANYLGDLAPESKKFSTDWNYSRAALGIYVARSISSRFDVSGGVSYLRLRGSDFESAEPSNFESFARYKRNLHFRNDVIELSFTGVFNILSAEAKSIVRPYVFAGFAGFYSNPQAMIPLSYKVVAPKGYRGEEWVDLRPLKMEDVAYSPIQFAIPAGLGVKFAVTEQINLGLEFSYRITFTDYLDDVSSDHYADLTGGDPLRIALANRSAELYDPYTGRARDLQGQNIETYTYSDGTKYKALGGFTHLADSERRGDPTNKDHYFTTAVKFEWVIGPSKGEARYR